MVCESRVFVGDTASRRPKKSGFLHASGQSSRLRATKRSWKICGVSLPPTPSSCCKHERGADVRWAGFIEPTTRLRRARVDSPYAPLRKLFRLCVVCKLYLPKGGQNGPRQMESAPQVREADQSSHEEVSPPSLICLELDLRGQLHSFPGLLRGCHARRWTRT